MGARSHPDQDDDAQSDRAKRQPESSLDLLARARAGDGEALDRLCARYLPALRRWARGRLPRFARAIVDTDDLVQDTLLQTLRKMDDFEPRHDGALQAYLRQALLNRIRMEIRAARRAPDRAPLDSDEPGEDPSPLEQAVGRENVERYEAALARLRREDREAVVLRIEMSYSYKELSEALGKPSADAARMAVMRAVRRLAEEIARER